MKENLKQRLVGAVVLLALAILAWPLVMGPADERYVVIDSDIPQRPDVQPFEIPEPVKPEGLPEVGSWQEGVAADLVEEEPGPPPPAAAEQKVEQAAAEPATPLPEGNTPAATEAQSGLDQSDLPQAWMLQVGSFSRQANADKLVEQLRESGYKAFSKPPGHDATNLAKVYVGPMVDKATAQDVARRIEQQFKLEPKVSQFIP